MTSCLLTSLERVRSEQSFLLELTLLNVSFCLKISLTNLNVFAVDNLHVYMSGRLMYLCIFKQGVVKVGAVNADEHRSLGGQYSVQGFPTIKVFGADKQKPTDYQGEYWYKVRSCDSRRAV